LSLFRYFEVGLRVWDIVVKKFTFAISSPDEFLSMYSCGLSTCFHTNMNERIWMINEINAKINACKSKQMIFRARDVRGQPLPPYLSLWHWACHRTYYALRRRQWSTYPSYRRLPHQQLTFLWLAYCTHWESCVVMVYRPVAWCTMHTVHRLHPDDQRLGHHCVEKARSNRNVFSWRLKWSHCGPLSPEARQTAHSKLWVQHVKSTVRRTWDGLWAVRFDWCR